LHRQLSLQELKDLIATLEESINSEDFQKYLINNLEEKILELAYPMMHQLLATFVNGTVELANTYPLTNTEQQFDEVLQEAKNKIKHQYTIFLEEIFDREENTSPALKTVRALLENGLETHIARSTFLNRKINSEKDKKMAEELLKIKEYYDKQEQQNQLHLKALQQQVINQAEQLKKR